MSKLERWQKPFKNLPKQARFIAVDHGSCYWYARRPKPLWYCWGFTRPSTLKYSRLGFIKHLKEPRDWRTAIRAVEPNERVKTK